MIAWDAVTESEGTGIVHIAPGCGAEDYQLGKDMSLPSIAPLQEDGRFLAQFGFLSGKRFDEVADDVVGDLKPPQRAVRQGAVLASLSALLAVQGRTRVSPRR